MAAFLYHQDQSLFIDSTINVVPAPHQPGDLTMASSYSSPPPLFYPNSYYSPDATTITESSTDDMRTTHESISSFDSTIQAKVTSSDHNCVQSMDKKRKNSKHLGVIPSSSAILNDLKEGRRKKQKKNSSSNGKKEAEILSKSNVDKEKQQQEQKKPPTTDYIHVRARRGQATDSHSLAERVRREKISERMKLLQGLVPGCEKVIGKALMLDEIINYVQSLQHQVEFLSMKLASVSPTLLEFGFDLDDHYFVQPQKVDSMSAPVPSVEQTGHIQPTVFVESTDNYCSVVDSSVSFLLNGHGPTTTAFSQEQGNLAAVHVVDFHQFQLNNITGSFQ